MQGASCSRLTCVKNTVTSIMLAAFYLRPNFQIAADNHVLEHYMIGARNWVYPEYQSRDASKLQKDSWICKALRNTGAGWM